MNRYVLKINNSSFVSEINWIAMRIPKVKTDTLNNAALFNEEFFEKIIIPDGTNGGVGQSRKHLLNLHYPNLKIVPVKIVLIEE